MFANGSDNQAGTPRVQTSVDVGVVGLGVMGHAIATRLFHELGALAVSDMRRVAASDLVEGGAQWSATAAEAAAHSDVIVLSLNAASIVEQVVFGAGGVLEGWSADSDDRPGLIIDMSSIAPDRTGSSPAVSPTKGFHGSMRHYLVALPARWPASSA